MVNALQIKTNNNKIKNKKTFKTNFRIKNN